MTTPPVRVERRVGQRFPYLTPVSLHVSTAGVTGDGFTQDLSSRGAFLFTDAALVEGSEIELTLRMPSEITLGESMRVRCRGKVLRVTRPNGSLAANGLAQTKIGVAVRFDHYEYLQETVEPYAVARASSLHPRPEEKQNPEFTGRAVQG